MEKELPTRGQLERQISQNLRSLYRQQFGHLPSKIVCHLFDDKLAIIGENATTNIEQMLLGNSQLDLARSTRLAINEVFTTKVKQEIVAILKVEVKDLIIDSVLDSGYIGIVVFLEDRPKMRKAKRNIRQHRQPIVKKAKENNSNSVDFLA